MASLEQFLACPSCGADVAIASAAVRCLGCGESWPVEADIPVFRECGQRYFYDFEYSEDGMRSLVERAESLGWMEALRTTKNKDGKLPSQYFIDYNSREDRLCCAPLLNPAPDKVALDYGCGMGAVSRALARSFGTVLSFDATYERAKFWDTRRRQERVENAHVFSWNGVGKPPLKRCSIDAVVLNGVLEWTPESIRQGSPWAVQLQVLRNIIDLLRPKGRLYLAIENRWAGRYLIGHRDHHSGLRFVTLLPRPLADLYSRARKGRPYRVHTPSLGTYRRLVR